MSEFRNGNPKLQEQAERTCDPHDTVDLASSVDASWDDVTTWTSPEALAQKEARTFAGFELVDHLGNSSVEREITLVRAQEGSYPQHVHQSSDAKFFIIEGSAIFLSGDERRDIKSGDVIDIPRGMPHGFEIAAGETLQFVSIQSPPIRNSESGKEDFELFHTV